MTDEQRLAHTEGIKNPLCFHHPVAMATKAGDPFLLICDASLPNQYVLEVVDVYKEPGRLAKDQVIAIPTLIKFAPGELKRLVGDLSQEDQVRKGLGLMAA